MVKKLLSFLIFLIPIFASAQSERDSAKFRCHEINIGYLNIFHLFGTNYADVYHYDDDFLFLNMYDSPRGILYYSGLINFRDYNSASMGIGYKYHFKTMKGLIPKFHALRFFSDFSLADFGLNGESTFVTADSATKDMNNYRKYVGRIGYQSETTYKKIVFYKGFDFIFQTAQVNYNLISTTRAYQFNENGKLLVIGLGGCPFLGIRFKINEIFSISTETRLRASRYKVTRTYSGVDNSNNNTYSGSYTNHHVDINFAPVGLISLNIHLVKKDKLRLN